MDLRLCVSRRRGDRPIQMGFITKWMDYYIFALDVVFRGGSTVGYEYYQKERGRL